ncbi:MAG TPA: DivIVA domain-containing protein [Thermoleophilia bacterium]|nr:DivIVA domain-containing protein [Thermoleophilia bacterium]
MKLTPLDIRHKDFKRGLRGYADSEVDEFLDEVADEFERLFKENIELSEQVESLQERVDQYRNLEETLQKTLVSAQKSAEELKVNAEKEAQLILREAEMKARQMVNDSYADKQSVEKAIVVLRGTEEEFRFKFKALLQGYTKQVEELEERAKKARDEAQVPTPAAAAQPATISDEAKRAAAAQDTVVAPPPAVPGFRSSSLPAEPDKSPTSGGLFRRSAAAPDEPASDQTSGEAGPEGASRAAADTGADGTTKDAPAREAGSEASASAPGVGDDLLADVETEVRDDEFKW